MTDNTPDTGTLTLATADSLIPECMLADRYRFKRKLKQLLATKASAKAQENFLQQVTRSLQLAQTRATCKPVTNFPAQLPVNERLDDIEKATNVKLNVMVIPVSDYSDKRNLLIVSGDAD